MKIEIITKPGIAVPEYKTAGAAGFDLAADLRAFQEEVEGYGLGVLVEPGGRFLVPTGISVNINNPGVALYILPRSGLGSKGIRPSNTPGLIDSDYQGELKVALENAGHEPFFMKHGDRIAQGVFGPVFMADFVPVEQFSTTTERGAGGFGSSGV